MKKTVYLVISIILFIFASSCAGYKPIYTAEFDFEIADYSIINDKKIGKKIYSKLYNLSKRNSKNDKNVQGYKITIKIDTVKDKVAMSKDTAGKVLEYKITLTSDIQIEDYFSGDKILNQSFSDSSVYPVQTEYSETIKIENRNVENIVDKIFQKLLIKMSDNLISK